MPTVVPTAIIASKTWKSTERIKHNKPLLEEKEISAELLK
jgi:hypothetical protein